MTDENTKNDTKISNPNTGTRGSFHTRTEISAQIPTKHSAASTMAIAPTMLSLRERGMISSGRVALLKQSLAMMKPMNRKPSTTNSTDTRITASSVCSNDAGGGSVI